MLKLHIMTPKSTSLRDSVSFEALSVKICRGCDLYACLKNKNNWRVKVTECYISPICL